MELVPLAGLALGLLLAGAFLAWPVAHRRGFHAGRRDQADIARILAAVHTTPVAQLHVGATERHRYRGTHRNIWRHQLGLRWAAFCEDTTPRDVDAPVRAALAVRTPTAEFHAIVARESWPATIGRPPAELTAVQ
jgi:hypothetical protein